MEEKRRKLWYLGVKYGYQTMWNEIVNLYLTDDEVVAIYDAWVEEHPTSYYDKEGNALPDPFPKKGRGQEQLEIE